MTVTISSIIDSLEVVPIEGGCMTGSPEALTPQQRIEERLSRFGRYLTSIRSEVLSLSLAAAILPGIEWAFVWRKKGTRYVLEYKLPTTEAPPVETFGTILASPKIGIARTRDTLEFSGSAPKIFDLPERVSGARAQRDIQRVVFVPFNDGEQILEAYLAASSNLKEDSLSYLVTILDTFVSSVKLSLAEQSGDMEVDGHIHEAQLFEVIHHEIKAWLGKSLGAAHLFLYDARDRMLYHRATDGLTLSPDFVAAYEPAPQAQMQELLEFVRGNIDSLEGASDELKEELHAILGNLASSEWVRENAESHAAELRRLLSLLPQEPGTGVAGHTALTGIPEISNAGNEALWDPNGYPHDKWFPLMLSVEQLFGIATEGGVAAVPLHEAGQLAGVLFVMGKIAFNQEGDTLALIEKAAQASPLLTLHRTQQFHQALARAAIDSPSRPITEIFAKEAHRAFNVGLVAHWSFNGKTIEAVTHWGFERRYGRYHRLKRYSIEEKPFREAKIKSAIYGLDRKKLPDVIARPEFDEQFKWGLPSAQFVERYEQEAGVELNSALIMEATRTRDIVILYFHEKKEVLRQNWPQIVQKLSVIQAVEMLRSTPEQPTTQFIGESDAFQTLLIEVGIAARRAKLAGTKVNKGKSNNEGVIIYGPSGSGKSELARLIYELSGREGRLEYLDVNQENSDIFNSQAKGQAEGSLGPGTAFSRGKFDNKGGTVVIEDIDCAAEKIRASLLSLLEGKEFTPLGGAPCIPNVHVIATTNKSLAEMQEIRPDMMRRFEQEMVVPPLSSRRLDVPLLARHFLNEADAESVPITAEAMCDLMNLDFEYDVDGLQKFIKSLVNSDVKEINRHHIAKAHGTPGTNGTVYLLDGTPYFSRWLEHEDSIHLFRTDDVYPPNPVAEEDWVQFPIRAFRVLAARLRNEGKAPEIGTYLSIGCGAGLDAVAAARILHPRTIGLTDLKHDVIAVARENVFYNSSLNLDGIVRACGSLFEALQPDFKADVIFENLPVIPEEEEIEIEGRLTGTYFRKGSDNIVPDQYRKWTLTSHYLFLLEAKRYLAAGGAVVCSIGARMPWEVVEGMFRELGYQPELLVYDLKEQEELPEVAGGLAKLEAEHPIEFRFFELEAARRVLGNIAVPTTDVEGDVLRGFALARDAADTELEKIKMTARAASERQGGVGHMVYIVRAVPVDDDVSNP